MLVRDASGQAKELCPDIFLRQSPQELLIDCEKRRECLRFLVRESGRKSLHLLREEGPQEGKLKQHMDHFLTPSLRLLFPQVAIVGSIHLCTAGARRWCSQGDDHTFNKPKKEPPRALSFHPLQPSFLSQNTGIENTSLRIWQISSIKLWT